jgi:hypothetical protein
MIQAKDRKLTFEEYLSYEDSMIQIGSPVLRDLDL